MAFRFRLATLLRYRERAEDDRAHALAQAVRRREAAAGRLARLRAQAAVSREALAAASRRGVTGAELELLARDIQAYSDRAAAARTRLNAAETEVEAQREELIRASRDRRILERLRELQRTAYEEHARRREQGELDDVASASRLWRSTGAGRRSQSVARERALVEPAR